MIWLGVAWFGQFVVFQTDYDEIEHKKNQLWRHFSDVIVFTSPKTVTNLLSQDFSILDLSPLPIKISSYTGCVVQLHYPIYTSEK